MNQLSKFDALYTMILFTIPSSLIIFPLYATPRPKLHPRINNDACKWCHILHLVYKIYATQSTLTHEYTLIEHTPLLKGWPYKVNSTSNRKNIVNHANWSLEKPPSKPLVETTQSKEHLQLCVVSRSWPLNDGSNLL